MKLKQNGFAILELILIIVAVITIGVLGYFAITRINSDGTEMSKERVNTSESSKQEEDMLVLENLGINIIDDTLVTNDALRDYASAGLKGFYGFGEDLSRNDARKNPNLEFSSVKEDAQIVSAIDGVVGFIKEQPEASDSEVFIQPSEGSSWTIGYDHLVDLQVRKGDKVKAGDALGKAAKQGNGMYRFEIQVNQDKNGSTLHYCPVSLLKPSLKEKHIADLTVFQQNWESVSGLELYDLAAQNPVGCLKETMTPAEAEGN